MDDGRGGNEWSPAREVAYTGDRDDVVRLIPHASPVLDVGCSSGALGRQLKRERGSSTTVWGIELDPDLASDARETLDEVIEGDAIAGIGDLEARSLRPAVVVFADVLEHVVDPWSLLDAAADLVADGGYVVVSVPNVAHWDTLFHVLRGRWPHRDRGIHDSTHLRFFGRRDVEDLLARGPLRLVRFERKFRILERPSRLNRHASKIAWIWPDLFTFQFLGVAKVERRPF